MIVTHLYAVKIYFCDRFSKQAVLNEKQFDFLKDVVASIPDIQQENDDSDTERPVKSKGRLVIHVKW